MTALHHAVVGAIEVASSNGHGQRFDKHSHDEFVISANLFGNEQVWLDGRSFSADAGSITTYNPGQIQGGGVAEGQPWHFVSLYVAPDVLAHGLGLAQLEFTQPERHLLALAHHMAQVVSASLSEDDFLRERAEERLLLLLGEIVRAGRVRLPQAAAVGREPLARLQEWLAADLARQPSLDEMAAYLGLSKFHLLRSFQKHVGLSPRQWAMQLRTRRAQGLLRRGVAATTVAHVLGFADQSHLNRHFRAAYGISPGRFQRTVR